MSAIEFIAQPGKSFSVQLYNVTTGATIGAAIMPVVDTATPTRYRADTGANTGKVHVVATATNLRVSGYADLDKPADNGYSGLAGSMEELGGGSVSLTVLPTNVQQKPRSKSSTLNVYVGETITTAHSVVDADGNPVVLTGKTLKLVIRIKNGAQLCSLTPAISGSSFSATLPSNVATQPGRPLVWALRDKSPGAGNVVLGEGAVSIDYAADED